MPDIVNPSKHILRKIHPFDIFNVELNQRVHIDVLESIGTDKAFCLAMPYCMGYKAGEEICGIGECVNSALSDCLEKIAKVSWAEFMELSNPSLDSD